MEGVTEDSWLHMMMMMYQGHVRNKVTFPSVPYSSSFSPHSILVHTYIATAAQQISLYKGLATSFCYQYTHPHRPTDTSSFHPYKLRRVL